MCLNVCMYMHIHVYTYIFLGFPGGSVSKESACNAGDLGLIPGPKRSPGEGICNPLQYTCLGNSMSLLNLKIVMKLLSCK